MDGWMDDMSKTMMMMKKKKKKKKYRHARSPRACTVASNRMSCMYSYSFLKLDGNSMIDGIVNLKPSMSTKITNQVRSLPGGGPGQTRMCSHDLDKFPA